MLFHKINGNKDIITNVLTELPKILKVTIQVVDSSWNNAARILYKISLI